MAARCEVSKCTIRRSRDERSMFACSKLALSFVVMENDLYPSSFDHAFFEDQDERVLTV